MIAALERLGRGFLGLPQPARAAAPAAPCRAVGTSLFDAQTESAALACARQRGLADCTVCAAFPCEKAGYLLQGRHGALVWLVECLAPCS